jgi:hypothetical protein
MALRKLVRWAAGCVVALATTHASAASSGLGTFSGNVEVDFPSTQAGVITLTNPRYPSVNPESYIAANNMSTGWSIKDVRVMYDEAQDTLYVGLNFFGIAGDADGNGNPGTVSPAAAAKGAIDVANLGGRESVTVGFYMTGGAKPDFLAGVPQNKQQAGPGLNGFTFSAYQHLNTNLAQSYGTAISGHLGSLFFNPSAEHPDFEFSVRNFSQLPGYDPINGFGLIAYAGSPDDTFSEEGALFPRVAFGRIPEPATILGWTLVTLGAAWRIRARRHRQQAQR